MRAERQDETVLVLAPLGRDADLACKTLSDAGFQCRLCRDINDICTQPAGSYGAILLTEEALAGHALSALSAVLDGQPAWSNLPVIVFGSRNDRRSGFAARGLVEALGPGTGVILLERPIRVRSFLSVVRSAVLARRRQYELRDQMTAREKAEAHARMLADEMSHRIKNSLALVGAIASQTFRSARPVEDSLAMLSARLRSMALAQDVLTQHSQDGTSLRRLIDLVLEPYQQDDSPDCIMIDGPEVSIGGRQTMSLMMAMHELATNAVKYGALSVRSGRVAIRWHFEGDFGARQLLIEWREHGGPPVTAPKQRGFGSRLVERGLAAELRGTAKISFEPEGVVCEISVPLKDAD